MPHHPHVKIAGVITDVFGHRFVVKTDKEKALVDIGPEAAERVAFKVNDAVKIEGEQKPTEIKAHRISVDGGQYIDLHHGPKHAHDGPAFTAAEAIRVATKAGFKIVGELTPHKKHYEATAEHDGEQHDIHVHKDHIMKRYELD